jgi:hypothetical protein
MEISSRRTERLMWFVALAIGVLQAFAHRDSVSHDGVAYLDLAEHIGHGDWSGVLNRYWSPLYPLLLGTATHLTGAGRSSELAVAHVVNLLVFTAALAAFAMLVHWLREVQGDDPGRWLLRASDPHGVVALYLLFLAGAARYTSVGLVTPDLLVLAVVIAIGAAIVRARVAATRTIHHVAFGALLCAGYFAKAVMLPLSLPLVAAHALASPARRARGIALSLGTLCVLAAPYVAALSRAEGEFTTGNAGAINLAWYLGGVLNGVSDPVAHGGGSFDHPFHRLAERPLVLEFASPGDGTYPPGSDPAYWHRGGQWSLHYGAVRRVVVEQLRAYWALFGVLAIGMLVAVASATAASMAERRLAAALWLAGFSAIAQYSLVHAEARFFSGFVVLIGAGVVAWARYDAGGGAVVAGLFALLGLAAAGWPVAVPSQRELALAFFVAAGVHAALACGGFRLSRRQLGRVLFFSTMCAAPVAGRVATDGALAWRVYRGRQVAPWSAVAAAVGDAGGAHVVAVASIGASSPAEWARVAGVRVIAEVAERDEGMFFALDSVQQEPTLHALARAGATVVVARSTAVAIAGWHRVTGTDYWVRTLGLRAAPAMRPRSTTPGHE